MSFEDLEAGGGRSLASLMNINGGVGGSREDTSQAIALGVFQINTDVSTFHCLVNTLGTPKDTPELRDKLRKTRLHIGQLVKDTWAKLKEPSEIDHQSGVDQSKKIVDAKLAKDFQAVLQEFQKAQRLADERETVYSPLVHKPSLPSSSTASEADVNAEKDQEQHALLLESKKQELVLLDNEIAFNDALIEEREQSIQEKQQTIGEVDETFKHMAVLVHNEEAVIDEIRTHIDGGLGGGRQDTTQAFASDVFQIDTGVSTLHRLFNSLGTPKDTPELRDKLRKTRLHIGQLVKDTWAKLKEASETDHRSGVDQRKKIVDAKLAKDFQAVLQKFQKAQRLATERETVYSPLVHKPSIPSSYTTSEADVNDGKDLEQQALLLESKRQELVLFDNEIAFNDALIEEREQSIQEKQQTIGEVDETFKHMAVLVHDEEAMIDEICTHIDVGVGGGRQDTTQAFASGVFQINTGVSTFHRLVNSLGTPKDTPELRDKLRKTRLHIGQLVKDTWAKLKEASEIDHQSGVDQRKKIVDAKLAKDFQAVLQKFQKAQRLATERETVYSPLVHKPSIPSSYTTSEADVNDGKDLEQQALLLESKRQELVLFDNEIAFNDALIEEREQSIQEKQQTIGEVDETFKHMAVLVHDEEAMIDEICTHIDVGVGGGRQDTTQAFASGVFQINTGVSTFHRLVNSLGTPKDTPELRDKLRKTRLHIGQLVKDTWAKLKEASEIDHQSGVDQRKKIVDAKLAKDFQAVLQKFQKAQRLAAERETVYSPLVHKPSIPSSYTASEADVNAGKDLEQQALLLESKRQELVLLDNEIAFNDALIEEREQSIQEKQQTIGEVDETFKHMAVLVHDEEAVIDEICTHIDGGVGGGRQDTTQAFALGVFQINTGVSTFHRLVNSLGTLKDTPELRDKLHKMILHIEQLVKDTSAKLKEVSETDHQRGVDQRKKIVDVAKDFQAVLNEFQKAQRLAAEREIVYAPLVHKPSLPSSYTASEADVNAEKDPEQQALLLESKRQEIVLLDNEIAFNEASNKEKEQKIQEMQQKIGEVHKIFKDMAVLVHDEEAVIEKDPEQHALLLKSKRQEFVLLDNEIAYNEASIEEREQKIQEMQQDIGKVHEIFKDVVVLVHDEEAVIDEIGTRIDNFHAATTQGKSQLARVFKTQRSNSSLACLLLVIFGIVLLIVIVVLVVLIIHNS